MAIDGVIGFIPREKNESVGSLTLPWGVAPDAIREAVWPIARTKKIEIDEERVSGQIAVLFPGPILAYERSGDTLQVTVWVNGGKQDQAQQLYDALAKYVP